MTDFASKYFTAGQLNALVKKLGGEQPVRDYLSGKVELSFSQKEVIKRLERIGEVVLPASSDIFDPSEFFKTREGLYVWDGFRDRILPAAKQVDSVPEATCVSHKLVKDANDAENQAEMPDSHAFEDTSNFCAHLAGMIDRQKGGKDGDLLANDYANIFYVRGVNSEVFAVYVYWNARGREWRVLAYTPYDYRWLAGSRAFSSN